MLYYQLEKKTAKRSVAYFLSKSDTKEQYNTEAVLALEVTRGHYGWCHSTEGKLAYIFFLRDHVPILRRFGVTAKKRNFRKKLVAMATSHEHSKIEVVIDHLQP